MTREDKLADKIMRGASDANIPFGELCRLLRGKGFAERIRGSHHIFTREDTAKSYQVKQVRALFVRYKLGGEDE